MEVVPQRGEEARPALLGVLGDRAERAAAQGGRLERGQRGLEVRRGGAGAQVVLQLVKTAEAHLPIENLHRRRGQKTMMTHSAYG